MSDQLRDQLNLHGIDPLQGRKLFVRKRDGRIEEFNEARICIAIESAFKAVEGIGRDAHLAEALQTAVKNSGDAVAEKVLSRAVRGEQLEVELIQDLVEEQLMLDGHLAVARRYILYREKRRQARSELEARASSRPARALPLPKASSAPEVPPAPVFCGADSPLLQIIYSQALPKNTMDGDIAAAHRRQFIRYINEGQYLNQLSGELSSFNLEILGEALRLERDALFPESGLRALLDRFLLRDEGRCIETPQFFWMRLAMGFALNEGEQRDARAMEFYAALSTFRFVPSEIMLAHAGTVEPQLTACSSATSWGDLEHVTAKVGPRLASRQKTGLTCSWLEPWHSSVFDFLRRPPPGAPVWNQDLNKALWLPDLFLKRVTEQGSWTLFDPGAVPDLHQQFGRAFEDRYVDYELKAARGEMTGATRVNALDLWREILASLRETGQPWLGFKDAVNVRSTQDHAGVVHSGSLCASILLNTSATEAAACSVGAVNLAAHIAADLDVPLLQSTIHTAMRMLDNALDLSLYPDEAARATAEEHRPAALGILGFQDALNILQLDYGSAAGANFADCTMELVSHGAILASSALARERGKYPSYAGSKWGDGLLPIDTVSLLASERGTSIEIDLSSSLNWDDAREMVRLHGMRHCTTTAISSTEAGSAITGASPSVEPMENGRAESAFKVAPQWLVECAARRQKWLDMGQMLTLFPTHLDLPALDNLLRQAWEKGLKTTRQIHSPSRLLGERDGMEAERMPEAAPPPQSKLETASVK